MSSKARPRQRCPVCGSPVTVSGLLPHVGSPRCLTALQRARRGKLHDPAVGPVVLELVRKLSGYLDGLEIIA